MIFLNAFISAILELLHTTLFIYYLAAAFVAFSACVSHNFIKVISRGD